MKLYRIVLVLALATVLGACDRSWLDSSASRLVAGVAPRTAPLPIDGIWIPCGRMGDGESGNSLRLIMSAEDPKRGPDCELWQYDPTKGRRGWAGCAYLSPPDNWGSSPGKNLSGYTGISFWARGTRGGEGVVFQSGGNTQRGARYPASHEVNLGRVVLSREWKQYVIPLRHQDLSNVVCAFSFTIANTSGPVEFFLDGITFE